MSQHVVVVDDSASIRRLLTQALTREGFEVTPCESAASALAVAREQPISAVITDLNMPEFDGLELTRSLRSMRSTANCPILILTTENTVVRKQEARQAGASGWILKPFQAETIVHALHKVCPSEGATA